MLEKQAEGIPVEWNIIRKTIKEQRNHQFLEFLQKI